MKTYVIYNKKANNNQGVTGAFRIKDIWLTKDLIYKEVNEFDTYQELFDSLEKDDEVVICGGDGTLNYLVNDLDCDAVDNAIYYYPTGTGNDFWTDLGKTEDDPPMIINKYLRKLPVVKVNGIKRKFINGIGYGIDGYCCEVGDKQRAKDNGKPINYTSIAIKGLLFHYKPTKATVTVDGVKHVFEKAWLAPTMNGRFYGGGMNAAPEQDRLKNDTLSVMLFHNVGRIRALLVFPSIFKGEHVKHDKVVTILKGSEIKVEFDSPRTVQIDGETVKNVTEYTAKAPKK